MGRLPSDAGHVYRSDLETVWQFNGLCFPENPKIRHSSKRPETVTWVTNLLTLILHLGFGTARLLTGSNDIVAGQFGVAADAGSLMLGSNGCLNRWLKWLVHGWFLIYCIFSGLKNYLYKCMFVFLDMVNLSRFSWVIPILRVQMARICQRATVCGNIIPKRWHEVAGNSGLQRRLFQGYSAPVKGLMSKSGFDRHRSPRRLAAGVPTQPEHLERQAEPGAWKPAGSVNFIVWKAE